MTTPPPKALGEKQERFGDSFTLASSYLHNLGCVYSFVVSLGPFSQILAEALMRVLTFKYRKSMYLK